MTSRTAARPAPSAGSRRSARSSEEIEQGGEAAWAEIVARYDGYSTREFLEQQHWPEPMIELFGLLQNQEALMNSCFLELLREEVGRFYVDLLQIDGGMDLLPRAFLPALASRIRFGARMTTIEASDEGVTIHYQTIGGRARVTGDYAIVTVPFPVLRHVEVTHPFSSAKRRAIRQLRYDASAKIFLQFRRRFWEEDEGIVGGGTVTDLPIRNVFYPEHGRELGRGVMLASYTWSEDAQRWGSLGGEERLAQALEDVATIHPQALAEYEVGASKMWHDDPNAGGAFALFEPGQQTLLHDHIVSPEGRVYFAGEHASLAHAWIQGAIESGLETPLPRSTPVSCSSPQSERKIAMKVVDLATISARLPRPPCWPRRDRHRASPTARWSGSSRPVSAAAGSTARCR